MNNMAVCYATTFKHLGLPMNVKKYYIGCSSSLDSQS